jgi:hypothetical protein
LQDYDYQLLLDKQERAIELFVLAQFCGTRRQTVLWHFVSILFCKRLSQQIYFMKFYIERSSSLIAAIILLQTLYFKFTGAAESIFIFEQLGAEPYGRVSTGVLELIIGVMLLFRRSSLLGAILGLGVMSGAILSHILVLGIEVQNDGGLLFGLALLVFVLCLITIILQRDKLLQFINKQKALN